MTNLDSELWTLVKNKLVEYHPKVRETQNNIVSEMLDEKFELKPADIHFSLLGHIIRGDYTVFSLKHTDTIFVSNKYLKDWQELYDLEKNGVLSSSFTFPDYVLNRVAGAEGMRTANYFYNGQIKHTEYDGMYDVGNWLAYASLKRLKQETLPIEQAILKVLSDKNKFKRSIKNPAEAYCRITQEKRKRRPVALKFE